MIRQAAVVAICAGLSATAAPQWLAAQPAATQVAVGQAVPQADPMRFSGFWRDVRPARRGQPPGGAVPGGNGRPPPAPGAAVAPPGGGQQLGGANRERMRAARAALEGRLQPWTAQSLRDYEEVLAAGKLPRTNANQCLPWAIPGIGIPGGPAYGMNIVVSPTEVAFLFELDHQSRIVYIGGTHPATLTPSYFGHSVGRWEGDTLVIDSIGFNGKTELRDGVPHTTALRVTERMRINEMGQLESRTVHEDPGAFLEPVPGVHLYERAAPFQEFVCAENNHEAVLAVPRQ
jgi:hypothetical protein